MKWKIEKSQIHGNGVFAATNISSGEDAGISLILVSDSYSYRVYERNTFGIMINDSDNPNVSCTKINGNWHFVALRNIEEDEEIVVSYADYERKIDREAFSTGKRVSVL